MIRITCYVRPHRVEQVKSAIAALGVSGLNVTDVRGTGSSPEEPSTFAGQIHLVPLPIRSKIEVVAPESMKELIIEAIIENARTGESGDGKIFVEEVLDAIRIRTEERGLQAI